MRRTRQRAFTLVEILVVVAIIGIATGVTFALATPDPREMALREAREFARGLDYATRRAQWRHQVLGVSTGEDAVRYWRRDESGAHWLAVDDERLRSWKLPPPVVAHALSYAGRTIAPDSVVPLRPTGRNEPFVFVIDADGWRVRVSSDPLNRVSIASPMRFEP